MAGKKYETFVMKGRPWWKIILDIIFSNGGMFCLCIIYAIIGAYIFIALELPAEEERRSTKMLKTEDVADVVGYLKKIFWVYATNTNFNYTMEQYIETVKSDMDSLTMFIVSYSGNYKYDGTNDWVYDWTFGKALLFTLTIMTSIGYGNIVPKTIPGKMFCIAYALTGIPILLVFMAKIGDKMAIIFRLTYSRLCCRWCRVRRHDSDNLSGKKAPKISEDVIGRELYMPTDLVNVPIMVCILVIIVYLFLGAFAFSDWEEWPLGTALYFCFITLTTIGFGDKVPNKSFLNYANGFGPMLRMVFTLVYIILGIAFLSMCIQLMQEEIQSKIRRLVIAVGMGAKEEQYIKMTKPESTHQTPGDMTGNELDFNIKRKKKRMRKSVAAKNEKEEPVFFEDTQERAEIVEDEE